MKVRLLALASLFVLSLAGATETNSVPPAAASVETNLTAALPEEIEITATRISTPQEKSPTSTTVITREQIEQSQQHLVSDVLRGVPGVAVAATGQPGSQTSVFLRGANSDQTLVLVDGIKLNNSFYGVYDFSQMAADNVERIEILRGPQSSLYGSSAMGGVINIVTKRGTGDPSGWVKTEYGSFNTLLESGGFSASKDKLSVMGDASYTASDNDRLNSDYQQYHFDGRTRYEFSDRFSVTAFANYFHNNGGTPGPVSIYYPTDPTGRQKTENALFGGGLNADPTDWWNAKLSVSHSRETVTYTDPYNYFDSLTMAQRNQVDFQNVITLSEQTKLLLGGTFENDYATEADSYSAGVPGATVNSGAAYTEFDYTPFKCLTLTAGGRDEESSSFGNHATYRLGARYTAPTETLLRTSLGTGYRAPNMAELYQSYYSTNYGDARSNPGLKPEESVGWDVGIEQPFLENQLRTGVTFFENNYRNMIAGEFIGLNSYGRANTQEENASKTLAYGIESFMAYQITPSLVAKGAYTWTHTRDSSTGAALRRRPESSASASLDWHIVPRLNTILKAEFVGRRLDVGDSGDTYNSAYAKLDLLVSWQAVKHLEVFARGENLTNTHYQQALGYPSLGAGVFGGLRLQF